MERLTEMMMILLTPTEKRDFIRECKCSGVSPACVIRRMIQQKTVDMELERLEGYIDTIRA